jgi:hypothetical protein
MRRASGSEAELAAALENQAIAEASVYLGARTSESP